MIDSFIYLYLFKMNNKIIITILSILCCILWFLYFQEKILLPVKLMNCDKDFWWCFVSAWFPDLSSCNRANEKDGRACDEKDPNNIICKGNSRTISVGYCK